ncbi:MAG: NUDIX domain-containing protein [Candidatus Babeliaceae bacterium]|nr:NUDIX domain-containing protein [Candidatus Babeliaceae bacterium]
MKPIPIQDELLDIVDNRDVVVRTELRSVIYQQKIRHIRAVNAFIINNKGQLWIPRRTATKALFPLSLDTSVGGHVQSGESYDQAFDRELQEETGLVLKDMDCQVKAYLTPLEHNVSCFMTVYEIKSSQTPVYNPDDFCDFFWITPTELIEKIETGEPAKSDLITLAKILYS